ncbi:MAG TPA: hypothetical protein VFV94_20400 [Polyangiaceae bacterium]|nr:hypothetical protein [Polyangiaceae bacterium]
MMSQGRLLGSFCLSVALSIGPSADAADRPPLPLAVLPALSSPGGAELENEAARLSARWAPVFLQRTSREHPERDRPLPVDFDGNWDATDNWRHTTPAFSRTRPVVYGSAILTATHAFLTYTLFYPRDWESLCLPYLCHDNDLEVLLLVVERGGATNGPGRLVLVETKAHKSYVALRGAEVARAAGERPLVKVESGGHGMYALRARDRVVGADRWFVPERATTPFTPPGAAALERYALLSLRETLWPRRSPASERGRLWKQGESDAFAYSGTRAGRRGRSLAAWMNGSEYTGGVRPPWALKADEARGDWFLDPALSTLGNYRSWFPAGRPVATAYAYNPYLDDLGRECAGKACPKPSVPRRGTRAGIF